MPSEKADQPNPAEASRYAVDTQPGQWLPDLLGPGFSYTTIAQGHDDEGPVCATLVRYLPEDGAGGAGGKGSMNDTVAQPGPLPEPPTTAPCTAASPGTAELSGADELSGAAVSPAAGTKAVLALHGWTDYFYNAELARFWTGRGYRFYALDLRRYGRSLRSWQTPGYVTDLAEYDADIEAALGLIRADVGGSGQVLCQAHSTGGLVASLWAHRNPGLLCGLVLNSPWLEMQGSWLVRNAAAGIVDPLARRRPRTRIKLPEVDHYWQSLSSSAHGEWDVHPVWRPRNAFPVTAGWISAVLAGHAAVARGLDIRVPVLVMTSDKTHLGTQFEPEMLLTDTVIEVETIRQRALKLGPEVTVARVAGGMHDLFTSAAPTRARAYGFVRRWAEGYLNDDARCAVNR